MKKKWNEIRLKKGKPDDIVIDGVDFHLEDMDGNFWWLGLNKGNKRTTFHLISNSKIEVILVGENELKTKMKEEK